MSDQTLDAFEAKRNEIKASRPKPYEKKETKYDAKNYLNTRLGDKELEKEFQIRVLPLTNDSDDIFEEVYFHWDAKAKKSFVCPKHTKNTPEGTNKECPYCDLEEGFWAEYREEKDDTRKKSYMKSANENKAQSNFVLRVIERANEDEGPKFWKIAESVLDNIDTVRVQNKKYKIDIFDLKTGKDLLVTFKQKDKKSKFSSLQSDMVQTPACEDENTLKEWIGNPLKWHDVYTIKSFEYLEVIINGGEPWFDKPTNKWIDKRDLKKVEEEPVDDSEYANEIDEEIETDKKTGDSVPEEDLPF